MLDEDIMFIIKVISGNMNKTLDQIGGTYWPNFVLDQMDQ